MMNTIDPTRSTPYLRHMAGWLILVVFGLSSFQYEWVQLAHWGSHLVFAHHHQHHGMDHGHGHTAAPHHHSWLAWWQEAQNQPSDPAAAPPTAPQQNDWRKYHHCAGATAEVSHAPPGPDHPRRPYPAPLAWRCQAYPFLLTPPPEGPPFLSSSLRL